MFKKLFLSIIILSTLASEGGAYFSADLLDYYLVNLTRLDSMQESQVSNKSAIPGRISKAKGTPAAFYKVISQNAIELKDSFKHNYSDFAAISTVMVGLAFIIVLFLSLNINVFLYSRPSFLGHTDSSPPVFC